MKLTVKSVQRAMRSDNFWLHPESNEAKVIDQAVQEGYVLRFSHTQIQWKDGAYEELDKIVKTQKIDDRTLMYVADEIFETVEEMFESKLAVEKFTMYEHVAKRKSAMMKNTFQKGFRIGNIILYEVLIDEGFKILHELEINSMLCNSPFNAYVIHENVIVVFKMNYENSKNNRKEFAKQNINVTKLYHL